MHCSTRREATPVKYRTRASKPDAQAKKDFACASGFDGSIICRVLPEAVTAELKSFDHGKPSVGYPQPKAARTGMAK